MPVFESPEELHEKAYSLCRASDNHAAALVWARAREAATSSNDSMWRYKAWVWEIVAWSMAGELQRAFGLLLALRGEPHSNLAPYERWMEDDAYFMLQLQLRPELKRLEKIIDETNTLHKEVPIPASSLDYMKMCLAFIQGNWSTSLAHATTAWSIYDGNGKVKYSFALWAVTCCLCLERIADARYWRDQLSRTEQEEWKSAREALKSTTVALALFETDIETLHLCISNDCSNRWMECRALLMLRVHSLEAIDDPSDNSHPARKIAGTIRTQDVHERYKDLLLLVDYRLACLRFTAGLPAVDDLYYQRRDVIPNRIQLTDQERMQKQLRSFNIGWSMLRRHSAWLDDLLQCNWHTCEAQTRRERCDAIIRACHPTLI